MKHEHAVVVQIYTYYIGFSQFARLFIIELYHVTSLLKINPIQTITFMILGK